MQDSARQRRELESHRHALIPIQPRHPDYWRDLSVEIVRTWTRDDLAGWAFSTSFASPERLGARRDEFERELRARLAPRYEERVTVVALLGRLSETPG